MTGLEFSFFVPDQDGLFVLWSKTMVRVGRLIKLRRSVYRRADGSFYYKKGSRRTPVHGSQLWETFDGRRYRGSRPVQPEAVESSDADSTDDELQAAILASLETSSSSSVLSVEPANVQDTPPTHAPSCSICMDTIGRDAHALRCGHVFHAQCVQRWLGRSATCPVCRQSA